MPNRITVSLLALALASAAACSSRTAAATQQTIVAFDPAQSDPKAIEVVDQMIAKLGGAEAWAAVKQIRWEQTYAFQGQLKGRYRHAWDLWNGRHRYEIANLPSFAEAEAQSDPSLAYWTIAMYDLFKKGGTVYKSNQITKPAISSDRDRIVGDAYQAWKRDSYQLTMMFKLRDPGVKLNYTGEIKDAQGLCLPACSEIKVTYAPEVGTDTYYVLINTESKLPEIVQRQVPEGRIGFKIESWATVNGLQFPTKMVNLGADEVFEFTNIQIGAPDDSLYVPQVFGRLDGSGSVVAAR